jgi:hypothetical protein
MKSSSFSGEGEGLRVEMTDRAALTGSSQRGFETPGRVSVQDLESPDDHECQVSFTMLNYFSSILRDF